MFSDPGVVERELPGPDCAGVGRSTLMMTVHTLASLELLRRGRVAATGIKDESMRAFPCLAGQFEFSVENFCRSENATGRLAAAVPRLFWLVALTENDLEREWPCVGRGILELDDTRGDGPFFALNVPLLSSLG
jgi:hypothetical protein